MITRQTDIPDDVTSASHDSASSEVTPGDSDTEQTQERVIDDVAQAADEPTGDEALGDAAPDADEVQPDEGGAVRRGVNWSRVLAFGVLPALALVLAVAAGFFKWQDSSVREATVASVESVQAAKAGTTALLSYKPDAVEQQLGAARDLLTGDFRDSYTSLTHDVVIPGAKQQKISATAVVPAAASVSASPSNAVVLVFVNQSVVMGNGAPTETASTVKVTLDKLGGHWLISGFDPV